MHRSCSAHGEAKGNNKTTRTGSRVFFGQYLKEQEGEDTAQQCQVRSPASVGRRCVEGVTAAAIFGLSVLGSLS